MQLQITALALLLSFFWSPGQGQAAQAELHAECSVVGQFVSLSQRTEERDENWAWAMPEPEEYTDVAMVVSSSELHADTGINNCAEKIGEHTFQLRADWHVWFESVAPADCLRGLSTLSGDEFSFGDWLYDLEKLDRSECSNSGN
ncbi:MAG: hypothetical protein AAF556_06550 [Pseudomonadota bacterium]